MQADITMRDREDYLKSTHKIWMTALNRWVIRVENLKKFLVLNPIGVGGQAKVYKIIRRKYAPVAYTPEDPA